VVEDDREGAGDEPDGQGARPEVPTAWRALRRNQVGGGHGKQVDKKGA